MKKLLTILLSLLVVFTLAACNNGGGNSGNNGGEDGPYKVAVATIFSGDQWEPQKKYFEQELAPLFNMEFIFSETLTSNDAAALVEFIEQSYAAGCQGVISFLTSAECVSQGARKCEEYGMYFETQNSNAVAEVAGLSHNVGHCGADPVRMGNQYKVLFKELLSDGQPHSLVLYSCAAPGGQAQSHFYSTKAMLETYQEVYGLKFEKSVEDLINSTDPGEVVTGRDDVKIYLYPGVDFEAAVAGCQAQLQTGDYDMFASCANFHMFTSAIDEVEKALNKNISIVGTVNIAEQTQTGFETMDSLGNPVLTAGIINPLCPADGINALSLYNALKGGVENMKDNGNAVLVGVGPFICKDAATYEAIKKLDTGHDTYVFNSDDLKALMITENPNVTWKDIDAALGAASDIDALLAKKGLR